MFGMVWRNYSGNGGIVLGGCRGWWGGVG